MINNKKKLRIALAGNANVGKSVIFNQLTGLNQTIGNWPGKTVEKAEGSLFFKGYKIYVIDLPGIYSLSTYSIEEIIARDYIATEKPDGIINVVDASTLERNLYFTIQLLELEAPIILDLNQIDFAAKKGIRIDAKKLSGILGIPVIPTVAISGIGINDLLTTIIDIVEGKIKLKPLKIKYGKEIEERIERLKKIIEKKALQICKIYPPRWVAIKLLEHDPAIIEKIKSYEYGDEIIKSAESLASEIEKIHGEPAHIVITSERYNLANRIAREVTTIVSPPKLSFEEKLDAITSHKIFGYPILFIILGVIFTTIFFGGSLLSEQLEEFFSGFLILEFKNLLSILPKFAIDLIINGFIEGIIAGITIALPYVVPFYIFLALLEDTGYLPRAAFLMDNLMHKIGLHGKAFIPLMLGYGCNVPACIGCRIMETERERFLAAFVTVLIPCAARTVIILGLVGRYVGLHIALSLYFFDIVLIFFLGRIAFKTAPGEPIGLIMEIPPYKKPSIKGILLKTWNRTKDFVYIAFPIIIAGSIVIEALAISGSMGYIVNGMSPLLKEWLGLPPIAGIPLIFGILRKELTLILLSELIPLTSLTPIQMIVFSIVTMIYIPCIATIATCIRELGWKKALFITFFDIGLALLLGGIAYRILVLLSPILF